MNLSFYMETLRLAINNLRLHKLRSFLTSLGIIIGVLAVITMLAIGEGAKRKVLKQVEQLGATNIILRTTLPPDSNRSSNRSVRVLSYGLKMLDLDAITAQSRDGSLPTIEKIVPLRDTGMDILHDETKASAASAVGTTPDFLQVANLRLAAGRFLSEKDMDPTHAVNAPVCVLGDAAARQLFHGQSPLNQSIRIGNQSQNSPLKVFQVVGVLQPVGLAGGAGSALTGRDLNNDVYFPLSANDNLFGFTISKQSAGSRESKIIELTEIYIRVKNPEAVESTAAALQQLMNVRHTDQPDVTISVPRELLNQADSQQKIFNFVLVGIAVLSLLIGGIGIMNISLATVTERTREIGVRRALGAQRAHIILQFLIETTTLATVGGLLGVVGGLIVPRAIDIFSNGQYTTHVTLVSVVLSFSISAVVGIGFGLYPAIQAAKMDPIEALRHD